MSAIDTYGEFDLPDEKSTIEVVEDPVKTIISCYELFKKNVKIERCYNHIQYETALKSLEGKEKLKPNKYEIKTIIDFLINDAKNEKDNIYIDNKRELFLSALHNTIAVKTIFLHDYFFKESVEKDTIIYAYFGNCLKENKALILGKQIKNTSKVNYNTSYSDGGTIINYGDIDQCCHSEKKGIHINFGNANVIGLWCTGGVKINYNKIRSLARHCSGTYINKGEKTIVSGGSEPWCIDIDNNTIVHNNFDSNPFEMHPLELLNKTDLIDLNNKNLTQINQKLDDKLKAIESLKYLTNEEEIITKVDAIDFVKLEKELIELADELKETSNQP